MYRPHGRLSTASILRAHSTWTSMFDFLVAEDLLIREGEAVTLHMASILQSQLAGTVGPGATVFAPSAPADVVDFGHVQNLPVLLAGLRASWVRPRSATS